MKKGLIIAAAMILAVCLGVGGTLAYLFVTTRTVTNTFSPSNIALDLTETTNNYKMIPGEKIAKDPKVTVTTDVESYVFVKIEKSQNYGTYLEDYVVATGWTQLTTGSNIYYRTVTATEAISGKSFEVLKDNEVAVKKEVTKDNMNALYNGTAVNTAACPTLIFTAYAIQKAGFDTAAAAWAELNP
jgi:hypothetical protein